MEVFPRTEDAADFDLFRDLSVKGSVLLADKLANLRPGVNGSAEGGKGQEALEGLSKLGDVLLSLSFAPGILGVIINVEEGTLRLKPEADSSMGHEDFRDSRYSRRVNP